MKTFKLLLSFLLFSAGISYCLEDTKFLFAHSFGGDAHQVAFYENYGIVPMETQAFDGPEVPIQTQNLQQAVLAQKDDVKVITDALKNMNGNYFKNVVGVGVSKGAATWINAAAQAANIGKIKALVLESPFANANDVIYNTYYLNYIPGHEYIAKFVGKWVLPKYNFDGMQPIDSIKNIANKDLPIFIIHSKEDQLNPVNHSRKLYLELIANRFTNVYLVETDAGQHANIIGSPSTTSYVQLVHAFYEKHKLTNSQNIQKMHAVFHELKVNNSAGLSRIFENRKLNLGDYANINLTNYKPDVNNTLNLIASDENYKPAICRFIIKTLIATYMVYKVTKYFPGVSTVLNNYMFKLMSLLKNIILIKNTN